MTASPQADASAGFARYDGVPVLVLGGTGFIGRWVVRALAAHGARVSLAARDLGGVKASRFLDRAGVRGLHVDLAEPGAVSAVMRVARPAVVFNLAAYGVDRAERDEVTMGLLNTAIVRDVCAELVADGDHGWSGARLVQAGSALEYGEIGGHLSEDATPNPTTDYGRTKLAATQHIERVAAETGLAAVTARLFTVYGSGEHEGRLLPSLFGASRSGARLPLSAGLQRRDFTYVEDVAEGLLRLGTTAVPPGIVVNMATGHLHSVREFVEAAASILPIDRAALAFGALPTRREEMWHDAVDLSRLKHLTSWVPSTTMTEGIRRSWEWEHEQR